MTDLHDHLDGADELSARLARLGDALDLDGAGTVDAVLARLELPPRRAGRRLVAAALAALLVGVAVHPDARVAVARWFGLDGLIVEVDPDLPLPDAPEPFDAPGPGESRIVRVDGREVLVSAIGGSMSDGLVSKTVRSSDQITEVEVMGHPGLWFSGGPHEVLYESADGDVLGQRIAGDTLLWHDGSVLYRVEGFDELADALDFVEGT